MQKRFISTGSVTGLLAVALGAFGAHALKEKLAAEQLAIFETAVKYQFYHALALLLTGLLPDNYSNSQIKTIGNLFTAGIILFSGSLYILVFSYLFSESPWKWLGAVTPFGGLCLMAGWLSLFIFSYRIKN